METTTSTLLSALSSIALRHNLPSLAMHFSYRLARPEACRGCFASLTGARVRRKRAVGLCATCALCGVSTVLARKAKKKAEVGGDERAEMKGENRARNAGDGVKGVRNGGDTLKWSDKSREGSTGLKSTGGVLKGPKRTGDGREGGKSTPKEGLHSSDKSGMTAKLSGYKQAVASTSISTQEVDVSKMTLIEKGEYLAKMKKIEKRKAAAATLNEAQVKVAKIFEPIKPKLSLNAIAMALGGGND